MNRLLALAMLIYAPHLVEEAATGMHDDPLIAVALAPMLRLSARHAVYLMFQIMFVVTLTTTLLYGLGGRWRLLVMAAIALALVGEAHHLVRAAFTHQYNSGLATALPMPLYGAYLFRRVHAEWRA